MKPIASIAGLFWAISLFLSLGTIPPLEIERLESVVIGFLSLAPLLFCGHPLPEKKMTAPRIGFLILLLWLLAALSCAWSVAPPISLVYVGVFSILPATILALLIADPEMRTGFLRTAGCGTALIVTGLATWTLAQVFWMPERLVNGQVRDPFANPNAFAGLLGLFFFTAFGLSLKAARPAQQLLFAGMLTLILCAFFALTSRTATLIFLAGLAIILISGRHGLENRWKTSIMPIVIAIISQIIIARLPDRTTLWDRAVNIASENAITVYNRIDIWTSAWSLITAHPWLGTGYRTFFLMYPSVRLPTDIYSSGFMAHSDPLQLWSEIGILGPLLFYTTGILIAFRFLKFWRSRNRAETARSIYGLALFLGCGGFVAHAHVDFLFYAMPLTMVFALVLVVLLHETGGDDQSRPFSFMERWPRIASQAAIAIPVLALLAIWAPLMLGEYHTARANRMIAEGNMPGYGAAINQANESGFGMNDRPYLLAAALPLGILQAQALSFDEQKKLFRQIDRLLSKALQRNARLAGAWHQRGMMLSALDPSIPPANYPDTESCFKTALSINPFYLSSRLALAGLYESRNEKKKALDLLADGLRWPYTNDNAMPYYDRTEKLARILNHDDLIAKIEKARDAQARRLDAAQKRRRARTEARLSTAN